MVGSIGRGPGRAPRDRGQLLVFGAVALAVITIGFVAAAGTVGVTSSPASPDAGEEAVVEAELERGIDCLLERTSDRSASTAPHSLETVGQELAGEIEAADRIAVGENEAVARVGTPRTVAGSGYDVAIRIECDGVADGTGCLRLDAHGFDVAVVVPVSTAADLEAGTVPGGPLEVVAADGRIALEVSER
ncbi:hypothetical protein GWG54_08680 [Natronococcus sp. JC468]|uniref:DUF7266 family protein n=1 Tax=Natronococcus sp. JC468 TaxID=1961921 RepID=UPI00143BF74B|nr:hypothetical protein [Natronococcus sp. JC468]NKE35893.1 hypothetical protein [Natronococcus sp. JC468]